MTNEENQFDFDSYLVPVIIFRYLCNKYLLKPGVSQENKVEWGYCFDVHLNALFPALVILHGVVIVLYHGIYLLDCPLSILSQFFSSSRLI